MASKRVNAKKLELNNLERIQPKIEQLYWYLVQYKSDHNGIMPTLRTIAEHMEISVSTVHSYFRLLEEMEVVEKIDRNKGYNLVDGYWELEDHPMFDELFEDKINEIKEDIEDIEDEENEEGEW